jgi:sRNA-binding regulator protein Hfq
MKDVLDPSAPKPAPSGEKTVRVRVEPIVRDDAVRSETVRGAVVRNDTIRPNEAAVAEAPASDAYGFASNRKLIRPSLGSRPDRNAADRNAGERLSAERAVTSLSTSKKPAPPAETYAEPFYFQKQMQSRTPMVVVLADGEELRGTVEWYDKDCIKLNRTGPQPNLLVYKAHIKYVFKDEGKR